MTKEQQSIIDSWAVPIEGLAPTCSNFKVLNNDPVAFCLERFIFIIAISVLTDPLTRYTRFCYGSFAEAKDALDDWESMNFKGKPKGYIKQKPETEKRFLTLISSPPLASEVSRDISLNLIKHSPN